jgi:hypothetical protein
MQEEILVDAGVDHLKGPRRLRKIEAIRLG